MRAIPLSFLLLFFLASCADDDNSNCDPNTFCTEIFVSLGVDIRDVSGQVVILERTETQRLNGEVVFSNQGGNFDGFHTILTDGEFDEVSESGTNLVFVGWLDGNEVVRQEYVMGRDCCHVERREGPERITLAP